MVSTSYQSYFSIKKVEIKLNRKNYSKMAISLDNNYKEEKLQEKKNY